MDKEYKVGDIIEVTYIINNFINEDAKLGIVIERKFDKKKNSPLFKSFLKLVKEQKEKYYIGEEVKLVYKITRYDEVVEFGEMYIRNGMSKEKFLEMMAQEE